MTLEAVTHRDGQQLEQDTVLPPCKELSFHPINSHTSSCSFFPTRTKVTPRTDSLSLTAPGP